MEGTEKPRSLSTLMCPLMQKTQKTVCHKCKFWEHVRGRNPNTGEEIDRWDCTLAFQFTMQMENNKFTYELGAAVESQRNELVELQRLSLRMQHRNDRDALAMLERTFSLIDAKNAAKLAQTKPPLKPTNTPLLPQREKPFEPDLEETVLLDITALHPATKSEGSERGSVRNSKGSGQASRQRTKRL